MSKQKKQALLKVNKRRKRIMILNHVPPRDALPDKSIAGELQKLGHDVFVHSALKKLRIAICSIKPDVIVFPEIRLEYMQSIARQCKEWGIQVVVRRGEMGHDDNTEWHPDFLEALYGRLPIYNDIDLELVWGPKYRDMLIRDRKAPPEKVKVVGAPFDHYFAKGSPRIGVNNPPKILMVGGFGYADLNILYCIPEAEVGSPIHGIKVKEHIEYRQRFIQLIKLLAISFPGQINVRVHPGEKEEKYIEQLDCFTNVYFCASEYPMYSILKNDLVIHCGSTMGYEAHLLNKPGLNFGNFCKDKAIGGVHTFYDDPFKIVKDIENIKLGESNAVPEGVKYLEDNYFYKVDGKFGKRVAKCIDALPCNKPEIPNEWPANFFKEQKYKSTGLITAVAQWHCSECENTFLGLPNLDLMKCPYCGIACIKTKPDIPPEQQKGRFSDMRATRKGANSVTM